MRKRPTLRMQAAAQTRRGFTLVELIVSLMVFGIGALAMVATSANVITLMTASKNRTLAAEVASAQFEKMRSQGCSAHTSDSTKISGISESWAVTKLAKMDDVTVRVTFLANRRTQTRVYRSFMSC
jgi:prepilin-type N-terminal cleavage/methylation domain-containing protein